jgi:hypothetical protein
MLISVHVPKTGGISFLEVLKAAYGERLLMDYADRPMAAGTLRRLLRTLRSRRSLTADRLAVYDCVHGHFLPFKYKSLSRRSFAIWFRDPVELVVSRYFYFQRHLKPDDEQFRKYIKRQGLTLEAYARIPHFHNVYAKYLFGMRLADFDFVGITENFDASLEVFRRMYGIQVPLPQAKMNTNPRKTGERYELPAALRTLIRDRNQKDLAIYRSASAINDQLTERFLGGGGCAEL